MCKKIPRVPNVWQTIINRIETGFGTIVSSIISDPILKLSETEREIFKKRVKAIIYVESNGRNLTTPSSAGELGVMQVKPAIAFSLSKMYGLDFSSLVDPFINIKAGTFLLYDNFIKSNRDLDLATMRYNAGWKQPNEAGQTYLKKVKDVENASVTV